MNPELPEDIASSDREQGYFEGQRSAWRALLGTCIRELGYSDDVEAAKLAWITEREATIAQLRMACNTFGDNDWDNQLHLADIIEKHLVRHLESEGST